MKPTPQQHFGSDNYAGICPEVFSAMSDANHGHAVSYGDDEHTQLACDKIREIFDTDCEVFFVFNGTAANALALSSLCQGFHSIICQQQAHIQVDECGAPELFTHGAKMLTAPGVEGKLRPEDVLRLASNPEDNFHSHLPRALSLTQNTECGTVYSPSELSALTAAAKQKGLYTHMDGARFANALVTLNCHPADITWRAGVDVLCLGGSKNGLGLGEAVVFFNKSLAKDFDRRCKQAGQMASKMRVLSSQWLGLLNNDVWRRNASHANDMAQQLATGIKAIGKININYPVQANAVFANFPDATAQALHQRGWHFYEFPGAGYRLMCAWDTAPETVEAFLADLNECLPSNE